MRKVLFIIHDVYQNDNEFPLGPAYLSSILREDGYDVDIYCMDIYHYTNKQLAKYLDKNEYDMICLGFMSARFVETVLPLCKVINDHKKKAKFVLGGPGASATPEYMLEKTGVDSVVVGEAENIILDIKEGINRDDPVKNLDSLPFPAWDLFPMDEYTTCMHVLDMIDNDRLLMLLSSRGCVNNCSFCVVGSTRINLNKSYKNIKDVKIGDVVKGYDVDNRIISNTVVDSVHQRMDNTYNIVTEDGDDLEISGDHPVYTKRGWIEVKNLTTDDYVLKM